MKEKKGILSQTPFQIQADKRSREMRNWSFPNHSSGSLFLIPFFSIVSLLPLPSFSPLTLTAAPIAIESTVRELRLKGKGGRGLESRRGKRNSPVYS